MGEMTGGEMDDLRAAMATLDRNGLGSFIGRMTVAQFIPLARRLAELERERDQWRRDFDLAVRESLRRGEERDTLRADLAHARAENARLRAVVEAARCLSDASLSMAAATSGGVASVNVQDVADAAAAMDKGWLDLDTALATLDRAGEVEP